MVASGAETRTATICSGAGSGAGDVHPLRLLLIPLSCTISAFVRRTDTTHTKQSPYSARNPLYGRWLKFSIVQQRARDVPSPPDDYGKRSSASALSRTRR